MGNVRILAASKEQAEIVAPFMGAEAAEALKKGLPITVLAAVDSDGVAGVLSGMMDKGAFDTNAFENGALKGEMAKLSFSELFRLDKEALKGKQK